VVFPLYPVTPAKDGKEVQLRRMVAEDEAAILEWQRHPSSRRYARNPAVPDAVEHHAWMVRKLADRDSLPYIILHDGRQAGFLRLDRKHDASPRDQDVFEVSILVAPSLHGKRIATAALDLVHRLHPRFSFLAEVLPANEISLRLFERAGYRKFEGNWHVLNKRQIRIGNRLVGQSHPCHIIAEVSCNHEGDFNEARQIIEAAAKSGADSVKLQTYTPDTITRDFRKKPKGTIWEEIDLYKLYGKAHTPWNWHKDLSQVAHDNGLQLFSSPFDETAVDHLEQMNVPAYKISSFEIVDIKLLQKIAATGKPVIMSNGMTDYLELDEAVRTLRDAGVREMALLHCNSGYPAAFNEANLATIPAMAELFDSVVGVSDHTLFVQPDACRNPLAHITAFEALKLGASIVEVHLTLDRQKGRQLMERMEGGFDWKFSREPQELKKTVDMIRAWERGEAVDYTTHLEWEIAASTHGTVAFEPTKKERASRDVRPSLWAVEDIKAGSLFRFAGGRPGNVDSIRPAGGLHVRFADFIDGRKAMHDISAGTPLTWEMVELTKEIIPVTTTVESKKS